MISENIYLNNSLLGEPMRCSVGLNRDEAWEQQMSDTEGTLPPKAFLDHHAKWYIKRLKQTKLSKEEKKILCLKCFLPSRFCFTCFDSMKTSHTFSKIAKIVLRGQKLVCVVHVSVMCHAENDVTSNVDHRKWHGILRVIPKLSWTLSKNSKI